MALNQMGQNYESNESLQQAKDKQEQLNYKEVLDNPNTAAESMKNFESNILDLPGLSEDQLNLLKSYVEQAPEQVDAPIEATKEEPQLNEVYENVANENEQISEEEPVFEAVPEAIVADETVEAPAEESQEVVAESTDEPVESLGQGTEQSEVVDALDQALDAGPTVLEKSFDVGTLPTSLDAAAMAYIKSSQLAAPDTREDIQNKQVAREEIGNFMKQNIFTTAAADNIARDVMAA